MNALVAVLGFAVALDLLLIGALVYAAHRIERLEELSREEAIGDTIGVYEAVHAKCIAHVTHYVGNEFAAMVLNAAADFYDSSEGRAKISEIINTEYNHGDVEESVPALWMRNRANSFVRSAHVPR